jgi:hypothetical protein
MPQGMRPSGYWGLDRPTGSYKGQSGLAGLGHQVYDGSVDRWKELIEREKRINWGQQQDAITGAGFNPNRASLENSNVLEQLADTINPVPISGLAGITKNFYRGIEKGTWDLAFEFPREMGSHGSVRKKIGEHFKSYYKDNSGELRHLKVDINPLETVDTKMGWNPWSTTEALKKKGWDKLSKKAQVKLERIRDNFVKEKSNIRYADEEESILVKWNKEYQDVLLDEGYDSISYPAVEGREAGERGSWESLILFMDPTRKGPYPSAVKDMQKRIHKQKELWNPSRVKKTYGSK